MNPTIGLEIHVELKTLTKMFCDSLNDPNEKHPNVNICPICTGHPGVLPTINKKAVEHVLKIGLALGGKLAEDTKFDRKNYFYPDLPKGYQLSQYDKPLVGGGELLGIRIRRIHLEEDAGRLVHDGPSAGSGRQASLVDFNRAGVPLMELVTEPDITSAKQAANFARELRLILRYLEVSDADMEKGQMRIEANISLSASGRMGTKVEVKNINSFKAVEDAINYELKRQEELIIENKKIVQETRGWDDVKKITVSQRTKEEAHDYRYFPEPDLPSFNVSEFKNLNSLKAEVPELPEQKRKRFKEEFGLSLDRAEILIQDRAAANFFEEAVSELSVILSEAKDLKKDSSATPQNDDKSIQLLYNYFTSDLWGLMIANEVGIENLKITPANLADLIVLISKKEISSRIAKDILLKMFQTGGDPHEILKTENLSQVSDENALEEVIKKVIAENTTAVADYKRGKENALQFLIGKTMAELKGRGNPQVLRQLFEKFLH